MLVALRHSLKLRYLPRETFVLSQRYVATANALKGTLPNAPHQRDKKLERRRVNSLLSSLRDYYKDPRDPGVASGFVHKKLDEYLPGTSPPATYEKVMTVLIKRSRLAEASTVYDRMVKEGFIPPPEIDVQMLSMLLVVSSSDLDVHEGMKVIFADPAYTEERLLRLLELMLKLEVPYAQILRIIKGYVETRGEGYSVGEGLVKTIVDAQVRAGQLEEALETIIKYDGVGESDPAPAGPYVSIMHALRDTEPGDEEAVQKVVEIMNAKDVQPDISFYNTLISRELRQGSIHRAFSFYHVLNASMPSPESNVPSPNASTFAILFTVLAKLYRPDARGVRSRRYRRPDNSIPPRRLFQDMTTIHAISPLKITSSILNVILRAFILNRDYAGAFVIIRSFSVFHVDVTSETYYIVMRHVMNRLLWDVKAKRVMGVAGWGERFMGITSDKALVRVKVDESLAKKILRFAEYPVFHIAGPLFQRAPGAGKRVYNAPTLRMIDGDDPVPRSMILDNVPLERILRRAIIAGVEEARGHSSQTPAMRISKAITEAKQDMICRALRNRP